jgi:hypothetical protein
MEGAMPASELTKMVNHYCFGAPLDGAAAAADEGMKDV